MAYKIHCVSALCVIISTAVTSLSCSSTFDAATLDPLGLVYRRPGDNLTVTCIANFSHSQFSDPQRYGPEDLVFTRVRQGLESGHLPSHVLNDSSIQTVLPNLTWSDAARYLCKLRSHDGTTKSLCSSQLFIGLDPQPLLEFRCISMGLETLACSWVVPPLVINNTVYKVGYRIYNDSRAIYYGCEKTTRSVLSEPNRFNCTFNASNYNFNSETLYFFIEASSPLNETFTQLPVVEFHNFRNVRPHPPEKLRVLDIGQRNASISWEIKDKLINLMDANGLFHEISLTSDFEEDWDFEQVETTLENLKDLSVVHTLTNLSHPFAKYKVKVRSVCGLAEAEDLWSGFSDEMEFTTLPDVPGEAPVVPEGAYYFDKDDGALTIYWEKVFMSQWNGPNFTYVVDFSDGMTQKRIETSGDSFVAKLGGSSYSRALNFSVSAKNSVGMLRGPVVHVPVWRHGHVKVKVELSKPGSYRLSWTPLDFMESVHNYTIFYCEKKPADEHNQKCKTQPQRKTVNGSVTSDTITLSEDQFYLFSVNSHSASGSSPLAWFTINGEEADSGGSPTVWIVVGSVLLMALLVASIPGLKWARRKYKAITSVKINVPTISEEGGKSAGNDFWIDKHVPFSSKSSHGPPLPTLVLAGGRKPSGGFVPPDLYKADMHAYAFIDSPGKEPDALFNGEAKDGDDTFDVTDLTLECVDPVSDEEAFSEDAHSMKSEAKVTTVTPGYVEVGIEKDAGQREQHRLHYVVVGDDRIEKAGVRHEEEEEEEEEVDGGGDARSRHRTPSESESGYSGDDAGKDSPPPTTTAIGLGYVTAAVVVVPPPVSDYVLSF
ncbi:unnamed protein product [Notodromas monacha]|uniref:Fibronectin type-III domain-containing protein n=1 Tax=Notodromas monacha TaxID=399045 RepID=A0A7R9G9P0_9CRUS|nr:unnamed protein product [Notodromas monacha]CAG0914423.1 unnamed protein product [Notodromas monacha]